MITVIESTESLHHEGPYPAGWSTEGAIVAPSGEGRGVWVEVRHSDGYAACLLDAGQAERAGLLLIRLAASLRDRHAREEGHLLETGTSLGNLQF